MSKPTPTDQPAGGHPAPDTQPNDFAARLGRHLLSETDPAAITDPPKPDPVPAATPPAAPAADDAPGAVGMAIGDMVANAAANPKKKKKAAAPASDAPAATDPQPAPAPAPAPAPTPAPAPEGKKKVGLEKRAPKQPDPAPAPAAPTPAPAPEPAAKNKTLEELTGVPLTKDERDYLELVRYAESKDEKLKGALEREIERVKVFSEFAKKWKREHPGEQLDKDDPEYKQLIKDHPPSLDRETREQLRLEKVKEEAVSESERKLDAKLAEAEKKRLREKLEPEIEAKLKEDETVFTSIVPEAERAVFEKTGIEGRIARHLKQDALNHVKAYRRIAAGVDDFDPNSQTHMNLAQMMDAAGEWLSKSKDAQAAELRVRDGKQFLSRKDWVGRAQKGEDLSGFWTFSDDDVVQIILGNRAKMVENELAQLRKDIEADGYARAQPKPDGAANPTPSADDDDDDGDDTPSPRSGPSPSAAPNASPGEKKPALSRFEKLLVGDPNGS